MDALHGILLAIAGVFWSIMMGRAAAARRLMTSFNAAKRLNCTYLAQLEGSRTAFQNAVAIADTLERELNGRRCARPRFVLFPQEIGDADFRTPAIYLETFGRSIEGAPVVVIVISTERDVILRAMNAIACVRCELPETSV